ncbi:MFS transporter [Rhodospirillaceae bacterium KN72]|uniref:MFS transporter n=1 Tax=Pacificispira spongiicola TaxID=2729598 RepID=A0A7Y0E0D4_9PROT|nr:MFS transporter [Pacificispira spongiicola]
MTRSRFLESPLADRNYRRLFTAQVIALLGTGLSTVALALLAYDMAGGGAGIVLGTALALKMVAYVGIAPIVGGFAHRLPRRFLLVSLDIARAAIMACLPFVTEVWQVYVLIFLLNSCAAGFTPTFQATIPDIVTYESRYTKALSLSRLAYDLENLLSPALAAALLVVVPYDALFTGNAMAFLASAGFVLSVRLPRAQPSDRDVGVWTNISFGVRAYLKTPRLRGLLALSVVVACSGAMVIVNTVVYIRDRLGGSETDTAIAFAATGLGSMIVALTLPHVLPRFPDRSFMLIGGALSATGLFLGLTGPGFVPFLLIWLCLGAGSSLIQVPVGRLLRRSAKGTDRPAYFAAQFALTHGCWLLAYPLAGWTAGMFGYETAFAVLAGVSVVATLVAARVWPREDPSELEHRHGALDHVHNHVHDEHHQHDHDGWEGPEPHRHPHRHAPIRHKHSFVIDGHHWQWPGTPR